VYLTLLFSPATQTYYSEDKENLEYYDFATTGVFPSFYRHEVCCHRRSMQFGQASIGRIIWWRTPRGLTIQLGALQYLSPTGILAHSGAPHATASVYCIRSHMACSVCQRQSRCTGMSFFSLSLLKLPMLFDNISTGQENLAIFFINCSVLIISLAVVVLLRNIQSSLVINGHRRGKGQSSIARRSPPCHVWQNHLRNEAPSSRI
jgi:hypothetical protein